MKAIQYYGPGDIRLDDVPEPMPEAGQVKLKVRLCGSDVHSYFAFLPPSPTLTDVHPVTKERLPVVMGHEFSGTIVALGPGVDTERLSVGKNVVIEPLISCMEPTCKPCSAGTRNICPLATFIGIGGWGGGLAEYIAIKQEFVHVLPDGISLEIGALIEPLSVAWHAVKISKLHKGNSALIIGAGPVRTTFTYRAFGASWVGISEPAARRRETALKLSASALFDPLSSDVAAETFKATGGLGADVVYDCAGTQATFDAALKAARPRGTVVQVAVWDKSPTLDIMTLQRKELFLTSSQGYDREHPEILQAVADGKFLLLGDLITKKIPLEELMTGGIKVLAEDKDSQSECGR
ncbi:hypothetical protein POSPLADRAFT_1159055 [Postia placenta MAD-698-R-SB12]|uniref:Enoyl reductase (ER) domain-containing protein n=1 Tax=Postia placenta MAD-698-R-SB12 TaxID=670580 RepID=A0A1X6ML15_9APHY|nr:hypothetical protein POSPLADRAFT_1159055 [Postia placenta MAD-698-R-SB12]OSX56753.1 hypothetical protein POSPLADRAFT_1159055 [Postia placenta MAD-698-R-SB12]